LIYGEAPGEIYREAILRRLEAARPRLLMIVAPAGYGKSTLARQFAARENTSLCCDCMELRSVVTFAHGVATALAQDCPDRAAELARHVLSNANDVSGGIAFVTELWSRDNADLFIFENVECILDSVECVELLARLLARAPSSRRIVICSRRPLQFTWNRFFAPHEVLTLRSDELCFDAEEIARLFSGANIRADALARIADATRGWPIAVLLFLRLSRERSLPDLLETLDRINFEDLYDYLSEQVLATMPPERFARLVAVAAIPQATGEEVAVALDDPQAAFDLQAFARDSAFLYAVSENVYEAHPLVRLMIADRFAGRCQEMLLHAARNMSESSPLRAAQLFMAAGEQDAAAGLLDGLHASFMSDLPPALAEVAARLDIEILMRHPAVWQAATLVRAVSISQKQWLHEALIVRERLTHETPAAVTIGVLAALGNALTNLGRHLEARAIFDDIRRRYAELPQGQAISAGFIAMIEARLGNFACALEEWTQAAPLFAGSSLTLALGIVQVQALAFRYRGNRSEERARLEAAIALARDSRAPLGIALALEEAAFGDWFAGEDGEFARHVRELEESVAPTTARGTEVFRGCARANFEAVRRNDGIENPKIRCYAALIGCGFTTGPARVELALLALEAAGDAGEPMLSAIACIACVESEAGDAKELLRFARASCAVVDSDELRAAVELYAAGERECGILTPILKRLRSGVSQVYQLPAARCRVSLARGRVECDGREVVLSNRELQLVMYLAARQRVCRDAEILEALWPDAEGPRKGTALRVYVRRVRLKLGRAAIVRVRDGYAIGEGAFVDLDRIERAALQARRQDAIAPELLADLERFLDVGSTPSARTQTWEWYAPVLVRVDELMREVTTLVGRHALQAGDVTVALSLAGRVIERDPCDEPARELRIRAHLAAGDRASAYREFRVYREILESELDAQPSAELAALVQHGERAGAFLPAV